MLPENEKGELLEGSESINLVENPLVFHIEGSSFPRNLLKKASRSSSYASEDGDNDIPERGPFLERKLKNEKTDEKILFSVPEDR